MDNDNKTSDIRELQYGSKTIRYSLQYRDRKTLGITVNPDLQVVVKAPQDASLEKIEEKLQKLASWIIRQQSYFLTFQPKPAEFQYVSGETHLYLGRQYRLQIIDGKPQEVRYKGRFIEIVTKDKSKVKALLRNWYRGKAKNKFAEIAEPLILRFKKYNVEPKDIYLLDMPTRWGSCTPKGKIILNPDLIRAPKACIEYVITHELCHLVHHNHTQKFLDLQMKEMPDWEKWKRKLEEMLA